MTSKTSTAKGQSSPEVESLLASQDVSGLQALSTGADKAVAKAARRALHQLRTRGVAAETPVAKGTWHAAPETDVDELPCYATLVDPEGSQLLILAKPALDRDGGLDVAQVIVHEQWGIREFAWLDLGRKGLRELGASMMETILGTSVVPWAYARAVVEEGYERNLATGRGVPRGFGMSRLKLGPTTAGASVPALDKWPEPPQVAASAIASMVAWRECGLRLVPYELVDLIDTNEGTGEPSPLVLTDGQKSDRLAAKIERTIESYFAKPETRARWTRRLLDISYFRSLANDDEGARVARAAAAEFQGEKFDGQAPFVQAFLRFLTDVFQTHEKMKAEGEDKPEGWDSRGIETPPYER